jgi:hypothetical protein
VFPRKNKAGKITSYRGAYVGPDGKRRYVSGRTKEETRRNLRRARGDAERGLVSDGGNVALSEYLKRWLNESVRGSVKPITHQSYEMLVDKHVVPALGNVRLSKLTPAHLQGFYPDLYAPPQHVDLAHAAWWASEAILTPLRARSMHDPANELPRIPLLSTLVNRVRKRTRATIMSQSSRLPSFTGRLRQQHDNSASR